MLVSLRRFQQRHPRLVGIGLATIVTAVIVIALWGQREDFATAIEKAPLWLLGCAVLLQIVALLTRTEAWRGCLLAAGGGGWGPGAYRSPGTGPAGPPVDPHLRPAPRRAGPRP